MKIIIRMAFLGALVSLAVILAKFDPKVLTPPQKGEKMSVENWIETNLANREATPLGFSEERPLWNVNHQVGWIRAKNTYGVTVMNIVVFEKGTTTEFIKGWPAKEFVSTKRQELGNMSPLLQGQRAAELQRFCLEMGIPVEVGSPGGAPSAGRDLDVPSPNE